MSVRCYLTVALVCVSFPGLLILDIGDLRRPQMKAGRDHSRKGRSGCREAQGRCNLSPWVRRVTGVSLGALGRSLLGRWGLISLAGTLLRSVWGRALAEPSFCQNRHQDQQDHTGQAEADTVPRHVIPGGRGCLGAHFCGQGCDFTGAS